MFFCEDLVEVCKFKVILSELNFDCMCGGVILVFCFYERLICSQIHGKKVKKTGSRLVLVLSLSDQRYPTWYQHNVG